MYIQVEFWHWWVLALCFVVFEAMIPSGVFFSMTIAAGILGAVLMQYPYLEISPQLGIFATISMTLTLITAHRKRAQYQAALEQGEDSSPAQSMIGKEFELTSPIQNGIGEIELDGQHWSLKGPSIKTGILVRVLQLDGEMLMVMPVDVINQYEQEQAAK